MIKQGFPRWGAQTSSISTTWELVRNTGGGWAQHPGLTSPPGRSVAPQVEPNAGVSVAEGEAVGLINWTCIKCPWVYSPPRLWAGSIVPACRAGPTRVGADSTPSVTKAAPGSRSPLPGHPSVQSLHVAETWGPTRPPRLALGVRQGAPQMSAGGPQYAHPPPHPCFWPPLGLF